LALLPQTFSIRELQSYVSATESERGFADESAVQKCLLLGEEVGELFKAVRGHTGIPVDESSPPLSIAHELADILNFLVAIANRFDIDLEEAYRSKEEINSQRRWR
jgi:NTP pyrophosphatase (non-canonical NTP hydrolase)